ncbi:hypothetical protein J437_LFUL001798 [Ladona fulva]|uniref:Uncharacterized protein n=1 Tax=Ladona fulva TaxID=123851 RepID=A0A8K0NY51_LADFU|nr:hypothetical protein J437_LFUL001798 [Ladona fulva]
MKHATLLLSISDRIIELKKKTSDCIVRKCLKTDASRVQAEEDIGFLPQEELFFMPATLMEHSAFSMPGDRTDTVRAPEFMHLPSQLSGHPTPSLEASPQESSTNRSTVGVGSSSQNCLNCFSHMPQSSSGSAKDRKKVAGNLVSPSSVISTVQNSIMHPWQKISACLKTINMNLERQQPRKPSTPKELTVESAHPPRLDLLLHMPPVCKEIQLKHAWNPNDRSRNIFVKEEDKLTMHRHPVAQSTDCIRGKVGYTKGLHVWEIVWPTCQRGTNAVVGVATQDAPLHTTGYKNLVGENEKSWGWDLGRNKLCHDTNNNIGVTYPSFLSQDETFNIPDKFRVVLDMDEGTLAFMADGRYLGVAFQNLKGHKLFPIVNAVWGHCEVTMRYMGGLDHEPLMLMHLCRWVIRRRLGHKNLEEQVNQLCLPHPMKVYLLYRDMQ